MTIYYLMVKTHNKSGLKYLCKTTQNPHTYRGSGKVWKNHLKLNGADHSTLILKECTSNNELSYWGRYYSNIFRVTTSVDDYGNRIWANAIPETGGGPGGKKGVPRTENTKVKIRQNKPDQSGEHNGFYQKNILKKTRKSWATLIEIKI